jgi:hypothetical protein
MRENSVAFEASIGSAQYSVEKPRKLDGTGTISPAVDTVTVAGTVVATGVIGGAVVGAGVVEVGVGVVDDGPVGGGTCSADARGTHATPTASETSVAAIEAPARVRARRSVCA